MKKLVKREKVNLWFSKGEAKKGKLFFVPCEDCKKVVKCTAITRDKKPPSVSSVFLSAAYLPIIQEKRKKEKMTGEKSQL
jgi:hypothetical protein